MKLFSNHSLLLFSVHTISIMASSQKCLTIDSINPRVREAQYAVRGELAVLSEEFRARLASNDSSLPFDEVVSANIGNPQQLGQKPITFFRQVLSLLQYPVLLEDEDILLNKLGYKPDVLERARFLLKAVGSVGAYTASNGIPEVRQSIANFLERRDGYPADPKDIYLSSGASSAVNNLLNIICDKPTTGVLVPIPQYPLYTATLSLLGARLAPYYLDESKGWGTDLEAIKGAYKEATENGTDVRAIVIINPGNPTGASLSMEDIRAVIDFAAKKKLVVMADEVYQTNVFKGKFYSFKRVLRDLQKQHPGTYDNVELASLHSVSKGMVGECGQRGGYFELVGFDPAVQQQIYKLVSITLCPPATAQCLVEMMVNPPQKGSPSYELYETEYENIFNSLKKKAYALYEAFKQMEGVECDEPQGSMYLFPTINLPPKAIEAAKLQGRTPDNFYAIRLLEATGICVVPGSGFGQKEGTLHFRTTFLAPGTGWISRMQKFHEKFMDEFR
ncbi:putative alanine aminotransferase [Erysiphe necator]|uniref:Glutamate pyruvate transaminase n=1 Tax=Uncinula necator TaxID=52586 RepID=A0A0B1P976_UNCNE|nr:putative alanine aminotransferase [Erysiphe necator]